MTGEPLGLSALFEPSCAPWIVHEDEDLIVVDKPRGVSTQSARPDEPDDLVYRLRRHIARREGSPFDDVYLGTHQRLDQETSGLLVFARRREANKGLARQFEERRVIKTYVALVYDPDGSLKGRLTLRDQLAQKAGRAVVVSGRSASNGKRRAGGKGKLAITHVAPLPDAPGLAREDWRWVELGIETGRTHQIRAQLAARGAAIVGDRWYGAGDPEDRRASRLMLHSARLELRHPASGEQIRYTAPLPCEMLLQARGQDGFEALEESLRAAAERRFALGQRRASGDTTAFRVVHGEADALPGLFVDVYGEHLVMHTHGGAAEAREAEVADRLAALGARGVYIKRRPRQANVVGDTRTRDLAPALPIRGEVAPDPLYVREAGVRYETRLGDGLSTGVFLDQRHNRVRVRELAEGRRMLNLFAYTGAFSVAAAAGGAASTTTVDVAAPALAWARRQLDGADGEHKCIKEDAFIYLARLGRRGARFDLIVCDPPTYSNAKKGKRWTSARYAQLARDVIALADHGADVLFCCNDARMSEPRFMKLVREGCEGTPVRLRARRAPADFPGALGVPERAKSIWVRVGTGRG